MFVAKDLESKIQDDLWLDQECYPETEVENFMLKALLKGHCHGDFAIFSSKWLKYLTKNLFSNMKLLFEHREGNIKVFIRGRTNYKQLLTTSLQYTGGT